MTESKAADVSEATSCYCVATDLLETLSGKYALAVLCVLDAYGTARFKHLEAQLPTASTATLSARLDEFREAGFVRRRSYDEIPPRVEYSLTEDGRAVTDALAPLLTVAAD